MDAENRRANTIASAIEINRPVNLKKALRTLDFTGGVVRAVPDEAILDAKALVGRCGIGCEPASAASVAGTKLLREEGVISANDRVACVLTGHQLKDPNATVNYHSRPPEQIPEKLGRYGVRSAAYQNRPVAAANALDSILKVIERE